MNFHVRIVTIAITTLLLLVVVFVWMTVLDKGTVEMTVNVSRMREATDDVRYQAPDKIPDPYTFSFRSKTLKGGATVECLKNSCSTKLPSGSYGLTIRHEGYFEEVTSVEVARGKTTKVEVMLRFVPAIMAVEESYDALREIFEREDVSDRFRFGMDTKYKKQRLTYRDEMVWAYFDRSLAEPAVFPDAALTRALAVDRSDGSSYLVTLQPSRRTWVGTFEGVEEVLWAGQSSWVLMKREEGLQWVKLEERSQKTEGGQRNSMKVVDWPFKVRFDQIVAEPGTGTADADGRILFLTTADLLSLESSGGVPSTLEVVKNLLNGKVGAEAAISLVEYTPEENRYRVLHTFAADLGLTDDNARLAYDGERWLVGDEEGAWEMRW